MTANLIVKSDLRFCRNIGKGNEGIVDVFKDVDSGKQFAIKRARCPPKKPAELEKYIDEHWNLYKNEVDVLTRLGSKELFADCLGTFIHNFEKVPYFCIKMPLYETTIEGLARKMSKLPNSDSFGPWFIAVLMQEVLEAVEIMHANNLVHRDLKPDNILVSFAGSKSIVKIGDFGFSRPTRTLSTEENDKEMKNSEFQEDSQGYKLSSRTFGGTPFYHPETSVPAEDTKQVFTPKDDIYSLGLIFLELMLLAHNSSKEEANKAIKRVKKHPKLLSVLLKSAGTAKPFLCEVIKEMIEPNVEKRTTIANARTLLKGAVNCLTLPGQTAMTTHLSDVEQKRQALKEFLNAILDNRNAALCEHYCIVSFN